MQTGISGASTQQVVRQNVIYAPPSGPSTPRISVPVFSGLQKDWDHFKELFTSTVINDGRISPSHKLEHLLLNVRGNAKVALQGVSLSAANFNVAWEKLLRRYDDKKRKLYHYLEASAELPKATRESPSELSLIVGKAEEAVKGLLQLGCPVSQYDVWLVHFIVKKLDPETRKDWAIHDESVEGFSTYKSLLEFLEHRISSLNDPAHEFDEPGKSHELKSHSKKQAQGGKSDNFRDSKELSSNLAQKANKSKPKGKRFTCQFCTGKHSIYKCASFLKLSAAERLRQIEAKRRCLNCFSTKHTQDCPSSSCCNIRGCGQKHNSLLHAD